LFQDGAAKGKDKGKSPIPQYFEDAEGRIEMPPSIHVECWKRPQVDTA